MKTSWSYDYLLRKFGSPAAVREWELHKRRQLEKKTGVPWDSWPGYGKVLFLPYIPSRIEEEAPTQDVVRLCATVHENGQRIGARRMMNLVQAAERLDWDLRRVVVAARRAIRLGLASADIGRTGKPVYVKVKRIKKEGAK